LRCLEKVPEDRPQSVGEVKEELLRILPTLPRTPLALSESGGLARWEKVEARPRTLAYGGEAEAGEITETLEGDPSFLLSPEELLAEVRPSGDAPPVPQEGAGSPRGNPALRSTPEPAALSPRLQTPKTPREVLALSAPGAQRASTPRTTRSNLEIAA